MKLPLPHHQHLPDQNNAHYGARMAVSARVDWQQDGNKTSHSANADLVACSSPSAAGISDLQGMQSADQQVDWSTWTDLWHAIVSRKRNPAQSWQKPVLKKNHTELAELDVTKAAAS